MELTYRHTSYACYTGYVVQAIINNLAPILFIIFQTDYGLSYQQLGSLVLLNFCTQIFVDLLAVRYVDAIGYRRPMIAAHVFAILGVVMLAAAPLLPVPAFPALIIAVMLYAVGGGLIEVLISPLMDSLPTPEGQKAASMSFLHSFYCWGQVAVVALSTLFLLAAGRHRWQLLPLLWGVVPLCNLILCCKVPYTATVPDEQRTGVRKLFATPAFLAALLLMVCAGASEHTIVQWASLFAEQALGVTKVLGDLAGPCLFGVLMGLGRMIYGIWGAKINLVRFMMISAGLCTAGYLTMSLSGNPVLSLAACALCGFSVSIMWPGVISLSSARFPLGGGAMFAMLAVFGDVGCSSGPWLAGLLADRAVTEGSAIQAFSLRIFGAGASGLETGLLMGTLFPLLMVLTLPVFFKKRDSQT